MIIHTFRERPGKKVAYKLKLHSVYQKGVTDILPTKCIVSQLETILKEWNVLTTYVVNYI